MGELKYDEKKFEELVLYIAQRCFDHPTYGATKLNKVLFFSDFLAYQDLGHPVTGAIYQVLEHGPAPRQLLPTVRRLEETGRAKLLARPYFGRSQKRLVPLDDPDLSLFSGSEIALVDAVIEWLREQTATSVSELSHQAAVGWKLAGEGEEIPYESVFLSSDPPTSRDIERGQELAEEHEWVATA